MNHSEASKRNYNKENILEKKENLLKSIKTNVQEIEAKDETLMKSIKASNVVLTAWVYGAVPTHRFIRFRRGSTRRESLRQITSQGPKSCTKHSHSNGGSI
jgi:hypothetical protein